MGPLILAALLAAWSQVGLTLQARPPATARSAPAQAGDWDDFPALLWRGTRTDELSLEHARALGGTLVIGSADRPDELPFLVFNAAGRDALHLDGQTPARRARRERWIETRADELLIRRPCLTDPATRAELFDTLRATLAAREGRQGLGVSLGDEVSLTPNGSPWDACLSPTCRAAWIEFLADRPELEPTDRTRLADLSQASTDAARAALSEGRTRQLEAWFLRREFHSAVLSGLLLELAAEVHLQRPDLPVGLLGVIGRTAFGGVDLAAVLPALDFVECYPVSNAREQLFTSRRPQVRALQTVFPTARGPHRAAGRLFEHWLRGGDGVVVWSDRELAASPAARTRIERAVRDVRRITREVGRYRPASAGVALVHSRHSIALAWLREALLDGPTWPNKLQGQQEQRGHRESSLRSWLRLLEDLRLLPGALPIEAVEAGTVQRFPVLVLHQLAVLDAADAARLEQYLDAGGTVVVDGDLGWIDSRGERRELDLRAVLAERAPNRVLDAPRVTQGYAALRVSSPAGALAARAAWWTRLEQAGVRRAPFRLGSDDRHTPFLCSWMRTEATGALVCAALPSAFGAGLGDRELIVEPDPGWTLDWIHPRQPAADGRVLLQAGDAAVFRLVPRR